MKYHLTSSDFILVNIMFLEIVEDIFFFQDLRQWNIVNCSETLQLLLNMFI